MPSALTRGIGDAIRGYELPCLPVGSGEREGVPTIELV